VTWGFLSSSGGAGRVPHAGSRVLWDYPLRHCGTPNRSRAPPNSLHDELLALVYGSHEIIKNKRPRELPSVFWRVSPTKTYDACWCEC
jgi:hypothetical protein